MLHSHKYLLHSGHVLEHFSWIAFKSNGIHSLEEIQDITAFKQQHDSSSLTFSRSNSEREQQMERREMEIAKSGEDRSVNKLKAADKAFLETAAVIVKKIGIIKENLFFTGMIGKAT